MENKIMKRVLIITITLLYITTHLEAKQVGSRIVHFPKDRAVGRLKIRDAGPNNTIQSMLQILGWNLLDQAQGEIKVPAGKVLRLEIYEDVTDFSFLELLKPDDLQALRMHGDNVADEELVHLKNLTGLQALDLSSTLIQGDGLVHLSNLKSLRNLKFFNAQISDDSLEHLSALKSLTNLSLMYTQIDGSGLSHLKNLTSLVSLDISVTSITDDSLVHLADMTYLKKLLLYDTDIGNEGLSHLKSLHSLEELILGNLETTGKHSPITDEGLIHLKDLDSLKELWLVKTQITDAGLAHLSSLKKLEVLFLMRTKLTGEGLAFLKGIPALKYLELRRTNIGNRGLANCRQWSDTLEGLMLENTKISDADLIYLVDLKALKNLNLSNTSITDAGLVHIRKLSSLENLNLDDTYITDDGLMSLKDLPNLQEIDILETSVTNEGLEKFKQISASKSVKANYRRMAVSSKEKGLQLVGKEEPQITSKLPSLLNKPLPDLKDLKVEFSPADTKNKKILVCFFDMEQRPSRYCINQLAKQAEQLKKQGVTVVAVQASKIDENKLNEWVKKYNIPYPIGIIEGDKEKFRFAWGVRSLPWLILTDKNNIVRSEGFTLSDLNDKIKEAAP
jgi:Leucine-rich repeat (LRR) protein